jgi:hypothetical protein
MVSILVRDSSVRVIEGLVTPSMNHNKNNRSSSRRFWQRWVSFMCTDLKPVCNARIDSRYKLDTIIEDVDGLVGLQSRLSQR